VSALIVCVSVSHGNTRRVAEAIGGVLGADVVEPEQLGSAEVAGYDLVGLGSGIYAMTFHPRLWRFVRSMPRGCGRPVFLFATSGSREPWWRPAVLVMGGVLRSKGYRVVGMFSCRGWDTWLPLRLIGGINQGRPADADLAAAREFASRMGDQVTADASTPATAPSRRAASE
jgi:flavodoxin